MTRNSMHPLSNAIDEAIWAAYRRDDKVAVMDYLLRRSLVGIVHSRSFPKLVIQSTSKKGRAAKRALGEPILINEGACQIPLRSGLN